MEIKKYLKMEYVNERNLLYPSIWQVLFCNFLDSCTSSLVANSSSDVLDADYQTKISVVWKEEKLQEDKCQCIPF